MIPEMDRPDILDIGCGLGTPTMELARLSNGNILGLDIDEALLDDLTKRIEKAGLSDSVRTLKCSMFEMEFPEESFDIIWSEGAIAFIGFERGLREWGRLLRGEGYLGIHDELGDLDKKLETVSKCGYTLLGHFVIGWERWLAEYFGPMKEEIDRVRKERPDDPAVLRALEDGQQEIDMFNKDRSRNTSVFFVMQKNAGGRI